MVNTSLMHDNFLPTFGAKDECVAVSWDCRNWNVWNFTVWNANGIFQCIGISTQATA